MSQLVACSSPDGLLLAADRRVVVQRKGQTEVHSVRKLFPLGPGAAVASSGAAVGILVSRTLSRLLQRRSEGLAFDDLEPFVMSVFQKEYDAFVNQGQKWFEAHPEAHRLSYVLLGGRSASNECALRFYASEAHGDPYRLLPTGEVLTAPRRLGLEARLLREIQRGSSLQATAAVLLEGMRLIAGKDSSVAGPFDVVQVGTTGLRVRREV